MAFPKYQTKEVLNKVLNAGEDGLNVDLADSVTVTVDSEFPAAAAITDNFANPTTTSAMSMLMGYDGSAWDRVTIGGGTEATALRVTIASDSTGVVSVDDGGGALTVDGTVTANLSATDNTVLDNIDSNTDYGATTGGGTESGALRVTIANNSTGVVSVDDGGGALTVDGTVDLGSTATTHLSEIEGAVETIETTVGTDGSGGPAKTLSVGGTESGGNIQELRVDSDGHLQIDVLSGGGGTEYSEDAVTPGTIAGLATMMERDDALGGLTPAEGDWASLRCDANGALWTHDDALDAAISGSEMQVDIVADGAGLATSANQLADGHNVTIDNSSGGSAVNIQDGGNTITVDGTVTANLSATDNAVLDTIDAVLDTIKTDTGTIDSDTDAIKTATESSNTHLGNMFYDTALSVTPSDGSDLTGEPFYAVYVGTGGDLKVDMSDGGSAVTLSNVASGQLLPIMVERIYSTGTTASNIIAFK